MKSSLKVLLLASGIAATAVSALPAPVSAHGRCHPSHHCYNGTANAVAHRASLTFDGPVLNSRRPAHAARSPSIPQPTPSWSVQRNGDEQPVDQHGIPLPGHSLGPL
jgi:hypothetical protein